MLNTKPTPIGPDRAKYLISSWFEERQFDSVELAQNRQPQPDPDARYVVEYEATFSPAALEQAQVEVWVTRDGNVAIGVETNGRVAERLGVKCRRGGFAAGHEPYRMSESGLLMFLGCVASGRIAISARVIPLLGLIQADAVFTGENRQALLSEGYAPLDWLKTMPERPTRSRRLLRFEPWH